MNNNNNNNNSNNRKMRRTRESAVPSPSTAIGGTPSNHSSSSRNNNSSNTHDMHSIHLNTDRLSQKRVMHSSSKIQHQQNRTPQISLSSAYDSYSIRGDTRSAYRMFTDVMTSSVTEAAPEGTASTNISTVGGSTNVNPSATTTSSATIRYNHFILSELRTNESSDRNPTTTPKSASEVLQQLKDLESNLLTEYSISESSINTTTTTTATTGSSSSTTTTTEITPSKERIDAYYFTYNRALIYYGISDYITSLQLCMESIRPHIQQHSSSSNQQNGSSSTTGSNKPQKSNRDSTEPKMEPVPIILFHLVFLLLECLLALGVGRKHHSGWNHLLQIHLDQPTTNIITIEMILDWLDEAMITLAEDTDDTTSTNHPPTAQQQQPNTAFVEPSQIKFLIPLYKSRIALSESDGTKIEQATRLARKDMKTAMEIFHNKLRPSMTTMQQQQQQTNHHLNIHATATTSTTAHHETDSVASSINSMDDRSPPPVIPNNTMDAVLPSPSSSLFSTSSPLTKYNQSALCVKAQLEQLKGNTKKSLILCTEAALGSTTNSTTGNLKPNLVSASTDTSTTTSLVTDDVIPSSPAQTTTSWYDAIHANNLAIIYATNDRKHLALHGMVKALRANTAMMLHDNSNSPTEALKASFSNVFLPDGTVKSDISTSLLYNTAICCLRTRNYLSAYECMVSCICHNYSRVFHNCTCYMYLSDACLGIYAQQTKEQHVVSPHQQHPIRALVEVDGVPKGVVLDNQAFRSELALAKQEKLAILGSAEDIAQVQRNPLLRARFCLQYVLQTMDNPLERDVIVSARLSMCYVELAFGNYYKVREMANAILSEMEGIVLNDDHQSQSIQRLHKRQVATVSLYLSEACCALGDVSTAMMHVLDEGGTDGKLNQLVSHLSGVKVEQASKSKSAQRRLLDANAKVRSCAAVITAATGNTGTAKELLQSVKITDDEHHAQVDSLSTRRALTYTFLRDRDTATALATLS